jgi:hypothetical protein
MICSKGCDGKDLVAKPEPVHERGTKPWSSRMTWVNSQVAEGQEGTLWKQSKTRNWIETMRARNGWRSNWPMQKIWSPCGSIFHVYEVYFITVYYLACLIVSLQAKDLSVGNPLKSWKTAWAAESGNRFQWLSGGKLQEKRSKMAPGLKWSREAKPYTKGLWREEP